MHCVHAVFHTFMYLNEYLRYLRIFPLPYFFKDSVSHCNAVDLEFVFVLSQIAEFYDYRYASSYTLGGEIT